MKARRVRRDISLPRKIAIVIGLETRKLERALERNDSRVTEITRNLLGYREIGLQLLDEHPRK